MKVIFVGMHNKPNMTALDSRTTTGKIIDRIIEKTPTNCIKSNLCDIDYLPKDKELIKTLNLNWHKQNKPDKNTIIILLGHWVQKNFLLQKIKIINLKHPAAIFGTKNKEQYIQDALKKIKDAISSLDTDKKTTNNK